MKYGIFGGAVNDGTVDDVVAEARSAEKDGFASYWAPNIFGHDALTCLAIVGREVPRIELGTSVVDRKSTRLNSSHIPLSRMPSSA